MRRLLRPVVLLSALFALGATAAPEASPVVRDAWIAQPPPGTSVVAGYLELANPGATAIRVVAVKVAGFDRAEMHQTMQHASRMVMHRLYRLDVAAGATLRLAPGGLHLMLFRPAAPIVAGQRLAIELTLDDGRTLNADAEVRDTRTEH